jgi:hypothetical protein
MNNKLTFANISKANIDEFSAKISELHSVSSRKKYNEAYWPWRYLKCPAGKGKLIIAIRNNTVVGKYGLLYLNLAVNSKTVSASLMDGLLIQPLEKSWQCYRGLIERCNLEKQSADLAFSFGIVNLRALELFKRLGVVDLGSVPIYLGFLDVTKVLRGLRIPYPLSLLGYMGQAIIGLRAGKNKRPLLDIRHVESFDSSFDELWDNISKRNAISIIRNSRYLNWRYAECPVAEYESLAAYNGKKLEGLVVFCATGFRNGSYILELFARDDDEYVMKELLARAFRTLKTKNIGYVTASFPVTTNAASVLRSLNFKLWGTKLWSTHMVISKGPQKDLLPELELKNWYFSLGDWLTC